MDMEHFHRKLKYICRTRQTGDSPAPGLTHSYHNSWIQTNTLLIFAEFWSFFFPADKTSRIIQTLWNTELLLDEGFWFAFLSPSNTIKDQNHQRPLLENWTILIWLFWLGHDDTRSPEGLSVPESCDQFGCKAVGAHIHLSHVIYFAQWP